MISDDALERFELVRDKYDEEYKNPFMVWKRVGGEHGYCGGVQVAQQVRHVMELVRFLEAEPEHVRQLAALDHPIKEIRHVLGVDRSQTHFCAKPDGVVMMKFNKGPTFKSTSNAKTAARFIIPHDVVLKEGDINLTPFVAPAPARPPADDSGDDTCSDSDEDIPITQILQRDATSEDDSDGDVENDGDEPPLGVCAVGEEVAFDFGDGYGIFIGSITEYDGDYYTVVYDDGDGNDFTTEKYLAAWKLEKKTDGTRSGGKTKKKKKKKPKVKALSNTTHTHPPTIIAIISTTTASLRKRLKQRRRRPRRKRRSPKHHPPPLS